jgi:RsmE family RNA methyltransferase
MNLILFERGEIALPLALADPRAKHIRDVLGRGVGGTFDCGIIDGSRGKGTVAAQESDQMLLQFVWSEPPPPLDPVSLLVGLPRPQTVRKILGEATSMGVARIIFFRAERSEPSYADSTLWSSGEVRRHLIAGAAQAFCTRLPEVVLVSGLDDACALVASAVTRLALDNYEAVAPLSKTACSGTPAALAIGAERGWSSGERARLRAAGFSLAHLGPRVLRTETACVAGLAIAKARLGLI